MRRLVAILAVITVMIGFGVALVPGAGVIAQGNPTLPPTNTPRGTAIAPTETATPTSIPTETFTPSPSPSITPSEMPTELYAGIPPSPTLFFPPEYTPEAQATGIPTSMPRWSPRDVEGNRYNLVNIVLIGHDSDSLQEDNVFRTDTMIVVSINLTTNTVSMLALPRDLLVWIPQWKMQRLNLVWGRGEAVGWTDGGWGLFSQTVLYNFGIQLHYYAMIDFDGFKTIIDRLDGVTIAVDCPIQDTIWTGEVDDEGEPILNFEDKILPIGVHHLDSREALWYARSRHSSTDFDRGRRQQQILRAIWGQSRDTGLITELPGLWADINEVMETNVPLSLMVELIPLALQIQPNQIENHFFRLGIETSGWTTPEGDGVQVPNPNGSMLGIIDAFLTPPTSNQIITDAARIKIYDGSGQDAHWDQVAADRVLWEGLLAEASGAAPEIYSDTVIVDYTGATKGSSLDELARVLNINPNNLRIEPDPNRTVDFEVFLGQSYNSCVDRQVEAIVEPTGTATP